MYGGWRGGGKGQTIACILDLCVAFKVKGRSVYIELG